MTIVAWTALVLSLVANIILFVNSFNKEADEEHIVDSVVGKSVRTALDSMN